jgi:hypothetical protein
MVLVLKIRLVFPVLCLILEKNKIWFLFWKSESVLMPCLLTETTTDKLLPTKVYPPNTGTYLDTSFFLSFFLSLHLLTPIFLDLDIKAQDWLGNEVVNLLLGEILGNQQIQNMSVFVSNWSRKEQFPVSG